MANKKDVHLTGALAAVLNSGEVKNVDAFKASSKNALPASSTLPSFNFNNEILNSKTIIEVDPHKICNWAFHDRPQNELGNIEELSKSLKEVGQQQPCVVRPCSDNSEYLYELIIGERRWHAAKLAAIKLRVLVCALNDTDAALAQAEENEKRQGLSDYAKGMSFAHLIESGIVTQNDIMNKLSMNKVEISRMLSFKQVPKEIWDAVGNISLVSSRTSSEIRAISNKGPKYIEALIMLADKIRSGKLGARNLIKEVDKIISGYKSLEYSTKEVSSKNGRHLFTWRKDSNSNISISFPKDIRNIINKDELELAIKTTIEIQLDRLKDKSHI